MGNPIQAKVKNQYYSYVLLTVHLSIILDNDQLDTHLLCFTMHLLQSSTCFEHYMLIIRRMNYTDAASGIVTLGKRPSGAQVEKHVEDYNKRIVKVSVYQVGHCLRQ